MMTKYTKHLFILIVFMSINLCITAQESDEVFDEFEDEFEATDQEEVYDPLISYNRFMHKQNNRLYGHVLRPVARGYETVIPQTGRVAVDRFFKNLLFPVRFVNNALQFKFKPASIECGRFLYNSTVGVLGFTDPAQEHLEWQPYNEDFGQTLGYWGVSTGAPIELPFFGPSNCRDLFGIVPDHFLAPVSYVTPWYTSTSIKAYDKVNYVSLHYPKLDSLRKDALDSYTFFRDGYNQMREKAIEE